MGISRVFDIAQSSLAAYQGALDVTANNIANSSNPDYSRQRANISAKTAQQLGNLSWGTGVQVGSIQRIRDTLIDQQLRTNNQQYSGMNQKSTILNQVQNLFSEPSALGLSSLSAAFFNSWQELSVTPNSVTLRNNVIQAAQNMSSKISNINDGLKTIKSDIISETSDKINAINTDLKQIQSLNEQIFQSHSSGVTPNDLMDQRDKVIDDLSSYVNLNISYDSSNSAIISIGGVFAADKGSYVQFKSTLENGKLKVTTVDGGSTPNLTGGELSELTNLYNNTLPGYQSSLDDYVNNLVSAVNTQHSAGYTISNPAETSVNFFDSYTDGVLTINKDIVNDPNKIAVSSDGTSGNGDVALNIANLSTQKDANGATLVDSYSNLIAKIGGDTKAASDSAQAYQLSLNQLQQQRSSYSGVSIDEEMGNVIRFQRSYDASAKLISIADQMLQTLLNI